MSDQDPTETKPGTQDILDGLEEEDNGLYIKMGEHDLDFKDSRKSKVFLQNSAFCFTACKWGQGECSAVLLEHLLITLTQSNTVPRAIVLVDSGIYLATDNCVIESAALLTKLEKIGVEILISESSLNHYKQRSSIQVGKVVKFHEISKLMMDVEKFVNF